MSKRRILEEGNPVYRGIDAIVVSPPSPQAKHRSLVETNPNSISSRQHVVDYHMMEYFLGVYYTMDEIRETISAHHSSEQFLMVQTLVG